MAGEEDLQQAARELQAVIARVCGDPVGSHGSWLAQVLAGEWDRRLSEDDRAAVADRLRVIADHLRQVRVLAGAAESISDWSIPHQEAGSGLRELMRVRLPLNRKERYYTGSVLPGVVAGDGLSHLPRFLALCGLHEQVTAAGQWPLAGSQRVQVFSEYNFAESLRPPDLARFPGAPHDGDTPDLVLCGEGWLLAVEAKMYHRPTRAALNLQMQRQKVLVDYWQQVFELSPERVRHVLLLPQQLADDRPDLPWPVVIWQQVEQAYRIAGDGYWLGVLRTALEDYDHLRSAEAKFGEYADGRKSGDYLSKMSLESPSFAWVGRAGGVHGDKLAEDVASGQWRTRLYEVRCEPPPPGNNNWMTLQEFQETVCAN